MWNSNTVESETTRQNITQRENHVSKTCQSQDSIEIKKSEDRAKDLSKTISGKIDEMKHRLLNKDKSDNYPVAALS